MIFVFAIWIAAAVIVYILAPVASWILCGFDDAQEESDKRLRAQVRSEMEATRAAWRS